MPTAIAIAVVEHEGQFLIGQRPPGVALAGFWEFPGGKVEPGETPAAAAARECREEAGVEVEVLGLDDLRVHQYDHGAVELHFFRCRLRKPCASPQAPFRWAPRGDLARYEFPAANAALLERLLAES